VILIVCLIFRPHPTNRFCLPSTARTGRQYIWGLAAALHTSHRPKALPLLPLSHPAILPIPAAERRHREHAAQAGKREARPGEAAQDSSRRRRRHRGIPSTRTYIIRSCPLELPRPAACWPFPCFGRSCACFLCVWIGFSSLFRRPATSHLGFGGRCCFISFPLYGI
jgi:hypothetical protein